MPIASSRLERLQIKKLLQCVNNKDLIQIEKLVKNGLPNIINYNDPDDGLTPLIQAVKANNAELLLFLLHLGALPDIKNFEGKTALMFSAELGNVDILQHLLDSGANKNVCDLEEKNVLFYCIFPSERHIQCLSHLLDKKLDMNKKDIFTQTALLRACKSSLENEVIICELLNNGSDPNIETMNKRSPLLEACASGSSKAVFALIQAGAQINTSDIKGQTAVHEAAKNGHLKVLFVLSAFAFDFNLIDQEGNNPLHLAAKHSDSSCKFLGQRGCDVKLTNKLNKLPRQIASDAGQKLCVKELRKLERGLSKSIKNTELWALRLYDWTIIHNDKLRELFIEIGQHLLMEQESQIEADELDNFSPEKFLDQQSNKQIMQTNLDSMHSEQSLITAVGTTPSDMNSLRNKSEKSSLNRNKIGSHKRSKIRNHSSMTNQFIKRISFDEFTYVLNTLNAPIDDKILKYLIGIHEKNSDNCIDWEEFLSGKKYVNKNYLFSAFEPKKRKQKKSRQGGKRRKNPMDICVLPHESIYRRADGGPPIMYIPKMIAHTDITRYNADSPPSHPFEDDSSWYLESPRREYISFHAAALHNDLDSIRLALSEGYQIDTRDKFYKTPLMIAAHYGNLDAAIELIKLGADVNARDNFLWTPLHHAAHSGMIDVVELLINNGASIEAKAINGATPLFRAIECSRLNVVDFLLSKGSKLTVETRKGDNPYDTALNWADPRVIEHVHDRWELVQESVDKQKKQVSAKRKRSNTSTSSESNRVQLSSSNQLAPEFLPGFNSNNVYHGYLKPKSFLNYYHIKSLEISSISKDIRICSRYLWLPQLKRLERLVKLAESRERFGWDYGLPDHVLHPFKKHLSNRFKEISEE